MKNLPWFLLTALTCCLTLSSRAQSIFFSGHVTSSTGIYSQYTPGTLVILSLDFVNASDVYHGTQPDRATYFPIAQLSIDFQNLSLPDYSVGVTFFQQPAKQGIVIAHSWGDNEAGMSLFQDVLTTKNVGVTRNIFPGGVPFTDFTSTAGYFQDYTIENEAFNYRGTINWNMENYVGSVALPALPENPPPPPPLNPVPEPSTYGLFGAAGLAALAVYRRRTRAAGSRK